MSAGGHATYMGESEMVQSDSMGGLGGLAGKGDFDRRKKKKWVNAKFLNVTLKCWLKMTIFLILLYII